ncbi:MAG: hypothetical protein IJG40_10805 [Oscillospiraceae bacterium]|nr:hypothetical protein [Oscillospiraceae bacterium]
MRKSWNFVMIIVLAFLILGAVCMGVGLLTGADFGRVFEVADHEYHVRELFSAVRNLFYNPQSIEGILQNLF